MLPLFWGKGIGGDNERKKFPEMLAAQTCAIAVGPQCAADFAYPQGLEPWGEDDEDKGGSEEVSRPPWAREPHVQEARRNMDGN